MDETNTEESVCTTDPDIVSTPDIKTYDQLQLTENAELYFGVGSGVNLKVRDKKNVGYVRRTCPHSNSGCKALFLSENSRIFHANGCIFGLTRWCKEMSCIVTGKGRIGNFTELVEHAKSDHDCLEVQGMDGEMELPITLGEEFGKPETRCFNTKIVGMCAWKKDGYNFHLAFVGLMYKDTVGDGNKVLQLLPILYGEPGLNSRSSFFVRVKMRLFLDTKGTKCIIPCYGKLAHPSHKTNDAMTVFVGAYRSNTQVLEAIEKNETVKYLLKLQHSPTNLVLQFTVDNYRCCIYGEQKWLSYAQFGLTWDEMGVDECTKNMLNSDKVPSPFTGVFLPQFKKNMNMVIATNEPLIIINHVLAVWKPTYTGPVKPVMVVMYPATFMLFASAPAIVEIVRSLGLSAVILSKSEVNVTEFFQTQCNVLITTPIILLDMLGNDLQDKWAVFLSNLQYVIVPDADFIPSNGMEYKLKTCINFFIQKVTKKIVRIAIMPCINASAILSLSPSIVEHEYQVMVLGPLPLDQIKSIDVTRVKVLSYNDKSQAVIRIIRDNCECRRFLIAGNEQKATYKKDFDALMNILRNEFPMRHLMRCDHDTQIDARSFDGFKSEDHQAKILLTSYYALHYDATKHCDCIIIFDNTKRIAIMLRILPLTKKYDGTMNKVYLLS